MPQPDLLAPGQLAPAFELSDVHGQPVRLSAFRGAKVVVLAFLRGFISDLSVARSWRACVRIMQRLSLAARRYWLFHAFVLGGHRHFQSHLRQLRLSAQHNPREHHRQG